MLELNVLLQNLASEMGGGGVVVVVMHQHFLQEYLAANCMLIHLDKRVYLSVHILML